MGATCCNTDISSTENELSNVGLRRTIAKKKAGKYLKVGDIAPGFYNAVVNALITAEERAGELVYIVDIYRALIDNKETSETP